MNKKKSSGIFKKIRPMNILKQKGLMQVKALRRARRGISLSRKLWIKEMPNGKGPATAKARQTTSPTSSNLKKKTLQKSKKTMARRKSALGDLTIQRAKRLAIKIHQRNPIGPTSYGRSHSARQARMIKQAEEDGCTQRPNPQGMVTLSVC